MSFDFGEYIDQEIALAYQYAFEQEKLSNSEVHMGIRQQIKAAKSSEQIDSILKRGEKFEQASGKTRRQWERARIKRLAELAK